MGGATAQAGDIGDAEAELGGAGGQGLVAIRIGDVPEDIGPLGIAGQEDDAGFGGGATGGRQLGLDRFGGPLGRALADRLGQSFAILGAVAADA